MNSDRMTYASECTGTSEHITLATKEAAFLKSLIAADSRVPISTSEVHQRHQVCLSAQMYACRDKGNPVISGTSLEIQSQSTTLCTRADGRYRYKSSCICPHEFGTLARVCRNVSIFDFLVMIAISAAISSFVRAESTSLVVTSATCMILFTHLLNRAMQKT